MKSFASAICVALCIVSAAAQSAPLGNVTLTTDGNGQVHVGPPAVPPTTLVDVATNALDAALRKRIVAAFEEWKQAEGTTESAPGLTFVGGRPILMVMAPGKETAPGQLRRQSSLLAACQFLLADDAFDGAVVCIANHDGDRLNAPVIHNCEVHRDRFAGAVKSAGKAANAKAGLKSIRADAALVRSVCTELGIP